jgi:hypothetical protein
MQPTLLFVHFCFHDKLKILDNGSYFKVTLTPLSPLSLSLSMKDNDCLRERERERERETEGERETNN